MKFMKYLLLLCKQTSTLRLSAVCLHGMLPLPVQLAEAPAIIKGVLFSFYYIATRTAHRHVYLVPYLPFEFVGGSENCSDAYVGQPSNSTTSQFC